MPVARWIRIYPDAAHGFLFQHHARFAADVGPFLAEARRAASGAWFGLFIGLLLGLCTAGPA
ncbi:MAG: hypothetical protein ACLQFR_05725 [Streptosporangiaceae bacterium]